MTKAPVTCWCEVGRFGSLSRASLVLVCVLGLAGCSSLPRNYPRTDSTTLQNTDDTRIAHAVAPLTSQHEGQSGLYLLKGGLDAFKARLAVADAAERSLDIQYFIWNEDTTGRMLADRLLLAADRGVRVRLLLDDFGKIASDEVLLALDGHTNIEVRVFNPLTLRGWRMLGSLGDYSRTTRRMHNKSFTADNRMTIIGGRNIGDDYFYASDERDFVDLDVLAVGPMVREVSASFDLFWNSPAAFPIHVMSKHQMTADQAAGRRKNLEDYIAANASSPFARALQETHLVDQIRTQEVSFFWGEASIVYDQPEKVSELSDKPSYRLLPKLRPTVESTKSEILVVSPYFVPGKKGVALFRDLRKRGVRVIILTNSLSSTDGVEVHTGYSRYRKALLRAGVELYELKPTAMLAPSTAGEKSRHSKSSRARYTSLHAKSFAFDRSTLFVGSLNLDPRSANLNTEVGVLFLCPELTAPTAEHLEEKLNRIAWRIEGVPGGPDCRDCLSLNWVTEEDGKVVRLKSEPNVTFWQKFKLFLVGLLPIESQL